MVKKTKVNKAAGANETFDSAAFDILERLESPHPQHGWIPEDKNADPIWSNDNTNDNNYSPSPE